VTETDLAHDGQAADRQRQARDTYRASLAAGQPLTGTELGRLFDRSPGWGRQRVEEAKAVPTPVAIASKGAVEAERDRQGAATCGPPHHAANHDAPTKSSVSFGVRRTTTGAVFAVAAVAAIASFDHQRTLAELAGEGWRSWLLPISVDGLVVVGSMTLLVGRGTDGKAGLLAWAALALGLLASLGANIIATDPTLADLRLIRQLVGGWPPVAFAIAYELLLRIRTTERDDKDKDTHDR
jgi:hypothetical protein